MSKLADRIVRFLTCGFELTPDDERAWKLLFVHLLYIVGIVVSLVFTVGTLLHGPEANGILDLVFTLILLVFFFRMRRKKRIDNSIWIVLAVMAALFLYYFILGGTAGSGYLWSLFFPLVVIFLLGRVQGLTLSLIFIAVQIGLVILRPESLYSYSVSLLIRYFGVYIGITLFSGFFRLISEKQRLAVIDRNKEYQRAIEARLKADQELKNQADFEKLLNSVFTKFCHMSYDKIFRGMEETLEIIGKFYDVDRAYVHFIPSEYTDALSLEWTAKSVESRQETYPAFMTSGYPQTLQKMQDLEVVLISSVDDLPHKAEQEKAFMKKQGIASMLLFPVGLECKAKGYIGFDALREQKYWKGSAVLLLKIMGQVFINSLVRKSTFDKLHESENLHKTIIHTLPDSFIVTDLEGALTYVSETTRSMFGYSPEDSVVGKNITEFLIPEDRERAVQNVQVLLGGTYEGVIDYQGLKKDGSRIHLAVNGEVLQDLQGNPQSIMYITRDVTDYYSIRQQLQASLNEKELLLKEIHHRVKNNLSVASSLLGLQSGSVDDPDVKAMFRESQNRIRSMAIIHQKLYESSNLGDIHFREYIESTVKELFKVYGASDVKMELKCDDIALPMNLAVPCGLIVNELITNSLKYAFPESYAGDKTVTVVFKKTGGEIGLEIIDNGVGLKSEDSMPEKESLGMRLVRILAEGQLAGKMTLDDSAGTRFIIRFPVTN